MAIARFELNESGELVEGVFFHLYWDEVWKESDWRSHMMVGPNDIISKPRKLTPDRSLVVAHTIHEHDRALYNCRLSKSHCTDFHFDGLEIDLRGDLTSDFVPSDSQLTIFSGKAASTIVQSGLSGFKFVNVTIRNSERPFPARRKGLKLVQTPRNNPFRLNRITPTSANTCYVCGYEPLCCPECGYCIRDCPNCEGDVFATKSEHEGEGDRRIMIEPSSPHGPIIEVERWDGGDVLGKSSYFVVTKRTIEFLLSQGIWPFWAKSLRANVKGISNKKISLLERAQQPI